MGEITEQKRPRFTMPPGATDSHFHVYDRSARFPDHEMEQALALHRRLGVSRGILVQADPQSRAITLEGLALAGANYRAITPIIALPAEKELEALHAAGMRGARFTFTVRHGGPPDLALIRQTVERIAPLGWHIDFLLGPGDLLPLFDFLRGVSTFAAGWRSPRSRRSWNWCGATMAG